MSRARRQHALLAIAVLLTALLVASVRVAVVEGDSMQPALDNGQIVLVNRLYRLFGRLRRGDVVLLRRSNDVLVKRVAYVPGDVVPRREARRFRRATDYFEPAPRGGLLVPPATVVVLGDNAPMSDDSRAFGPVPAGDIIGRVVGAPAGR